MITAQISSARVSLSLSNCWNFQPDDLSSRTSDKHAQLGHQGDGIQPIARLLGRERVDSGVEERDIIMSLSICDLQ